MQLYIDRETFQSMGMDKTLLLCVTFGAGHSFEMESKEKAKETVFFCEKQNSNYLIYLLVLCFCFLQVKKAHLSYAITRVTLIGSLQWD